MGFGKAALFAVATALLLASISSSSAPIVEAGAGRDGLYVVCMTTVLASIVRQIGGEYVEVEAIVPAGFCPGHYNIKPSDIVAVRNADILLGHIKVFDWVRDLLEAAGRPIDELEMLRGPWNTPGRAISYVKNITNILCAHPKANSTMRDHFVRMNATVCSELQELASSLEAKAQELGVGAVKVICMKWQAPFVEWLGFDIIATFKPPELLTPEEIEALVAAGKEARAAMVIDNLQSGTEVGAEVAREIGAEHVVLTNFPDAVPGTPTLADVMRYNAAQLFNATERWRFKGEELRRLEAEVEALKGQNTLFLGLTISFAMVAIAEAVVLFFMRRAGRKAP